MSAQDFPRHWKSIVVNIRASRPKDECAVILLKGDWFPFEEAAKAAHLGVNGVVRENLTDKTERSRFQQILKRYMEIDDSRLTDRQVPDELDRVDFMFSHPVNALHRTRAHRNHFKQRSVLPARFPCPCL
jgi:hypothetical protein